ncbi:MAG: addiction module antidote protein [Ignavibacteriota bacterium]
MTTKRTKQNKSISYEEELHRSLQDADEALAYLKASFEDDDAQVFLLALADVAKAQGGISVLAKRSGLNRESLYRTLSEKGNPKLQSIDSILHSLGMKLSVEKLSIQ